MNDQRYYGHSRSRSSGHQQRLRTIYSQDDNPLRSVTTALTDCTDLSAAVRARQKSKTGVGHHRAAIENSHPQKQSGEFKPNRNHSNRDQALNVSPSDISDLSLRIKQKYRGLLASDDESSTHDDTASERSQPSAPSPLVRPQQLPARSSTSFLRGQNKARAEVVLALRNVNASELQRGSRNHTKSDASSVQSGAVAKPIDLTNAVVGITPSITEAPPPATNQPPRKEKTSSSARREVRSSLHPPIPVDRGYDRSERGFTTNRERQTQPYLESVGSSRQDLSTVRPLTKKEAKEAFRNNDLPVIPFYLQDINDFSSLSTTRPTKTTSDHRDKRERKASRERHQRSCSPKRSTRPHPPSSTRPESPLTRSQRQTRGDGSESPLRRDGLIDVEQPKDRIVSVHLAKNPARQSTLTVPQLPRLVTHEQASRVARCGDGEELKSESETSRSKLEIFFFVLVVLAVLALGILLGIILS
jgi:hypothetical protein